MQVRRIGCGTKLTTSDPRLRSKEIGDTMVWKEYHDINQVSSLMPLDLSLTVLFLTNVAKNFALPHLIMENKVNNGK